MFSTLYSNKIHILILIIGNFLVNIWKILLNERIFSKISINIQSGLII